MKQVGVIVWQVLWEILKFCWQIVLLFLILLAYWYVKEWSGEQNPFHEEFKKPPAERWK